MGQNVIPYHVSLPQFTFPESVIRDHIPDIGHTVHVLVGSADTSTGGWRKAFQNVFDSDSSLLVLLSAALRKMACDWEWDEMTRLSARRMLWLQ